MDNELLAGWLHERKFIYFLLARLYKTCPKAPLLQTLAADRTLLAVAKKHVPAGTAVHSEIYTAVQRLQAELDLAVKNPGGYQKRLQTDFNSLFVGPGHVLAPPWESVYRSAEKLLCGEHALAVRAFYRSFGLASRQSRLEPDDHLSLELEFMAWLCQQASKPAVIHTNQMNSYVSGQTCFLSGHISQWVPALCDDIRKVAESGFYRELASLTKHWLIADAAAVANIANRLKRPCSTP